MILFVSGRTCLYLKMFLSIFPIDTNNILLKLAVVKYECQVHKSFTLKEKSLRIRK